MTEYSCVDCFSGAGGLALGLSSAGIKPLLSFDIDKRCIDSFRMNTKYFNHVALCEGIDSMLGGRLLNMVGKKKGELFLLAGGPPCQGFSVQRIGKDDDPRNLLVLQYAQLIEEVMPKYFLMENVSGIRGKRGKTVLTELERRLTAAGYQLHEQLLDAQDYGVPQRRKRFVVVGERLGSKPCCFEFPQPSTVRHTVRDTIGMLPEPPKDGSPHPDYPLHRRDRLSELNKKRLSALKEGQGRDSLPEELLADCHKRSSATIGHRNVYGRMSWDDVAPTITARFDSFTRGQFGHPDQLRSISLLEGALLQTFPSDFSFSGNKVEIARQIGNAVPPVLAEAIGRSIIECEKRKGGEECNSTR